MNQRRLEIGVGLFVLAGAACLIYLTIFIGQVGSLGHNEYLVFAEFTSVEGLREGASVEIAGVPVGRVGKITLDDERARVELRIKAGVELDKDVICSVRTKGIIGEKFLRLMPGGAEELIKPGGRIKITESGVDLQDVVGELIHKF